MYNDSGLLCRELKVRVACGEGQNKAKFKKEEEESIPFFFFRKNSVLVSVHCETNGRQGE